MDGPGGLRGGGLFTGWSVTTNTFRCWCDACFAQILRYKYSRFSDMCGGGRRSFNMTDTVNYSQRIGGTSSAISLFYYFAISGRGGVTAWTSRLSRNWRMATTLNIFLA